MFNGLAVSYDYTHNYLSKNMVSPFCVHKVLKAGHMGMYVVVEEGNSFNFPLLLAGIWMQVLLNPQRKCASIGLTTNFALIPCKVALWYVVLYVEPTHSYR